MSLQGQVALVTGASRGIGAAIADELANGGATVAGTATTPEGAERITQRFKELNVNGQGFVLNLSDPNSIDAAVKSVSDSLGAPTILVNNAGITRDNLMLRMKEDEWLDVIETNLSGVYRLTKSCLRPMIKNRQGRIVMISSVVGSTGSAGQANYAAAKAGLLGFSKSLAQEIASRGVTVNAVSPGFIATDMTGELTDDQKESIMRLIPSQKVGKPEDIAYAVRFLVSPEAAYITGETLHVNGGMYMS